MKIDELQAYEVVSGRLIEDLNSESYILRHRKTGARIALLSNDDENKVFYIGFRTPPKDSTGVPHIIEHSVLCGSREFPVKDPFVELVKGSLNTFLNAMTYPDKTVYPVASCNDKDFQNLMHVYLDAVFYPNIYKNEKIFMQEGWHYEMESPDADLTINGVVYNEMKGAFSSPDDVFERELMSSLYPDTAYSVESGGDPNVIPQLTYEQFLDFHRKYYHPSNSYIYLYGDMDMAEKLSFIDEHYLSHFDALQVDSALSIQAPFDKVNRVVKEYPIGDEEEEDSNAYLSYNVSVGDSLDRDLYVAFQVLDYALCSAPGAPLKQALIHQGIGKDVHSIYDNGILQPYFSIVAKNAGADKEEIFLHTIRSVLNDLTENGMDQKALSAGIQYYEFKYREADFGSYPKGLMYGLQILDSWLYDDDKPFIHVEANDTFARLKQKVKEGYFEELIKKYLLENPHCSIVVLLPKKGLSLERERCFKAQMEAIKAGLTEEQINEIIRKANELEEYQETEDSKEDIEKLPLLTRSDMKKEATGFVNEELLIKDTKVLFHELFTNGIGYLRLIFKVDEIPESHFSYVGLVKGCLGLLNTEHYSYSDLFNEMNMVTGGVSAVNNVYCRIEDQDDYTVTLEIKTKALYENLNKAVELMGEMILTSDFEDTKRLYEIVAEGQSRLQSQMISSGHSVAAGRVLSYGSASGVICEMLSGVPLYRMMCDLEGNYEEKKEDMVCKLKELCEMIFRPENLMVDFTGERNALSLLETPITALKEKLYTGMVPKAKFVPLVEKRNEGFKTSGQVQYVCRGGNFCKKGLPYKGTLKALKVMMGYGYLWENVRVKGGAYGCMCSFGKSGDCYFVSYRDPNLKKTIDVFEKAAEAVEQFDADERTMTQYIIGAVSELDMPMNPAAKGLRSLSAYMTGLTREVLQKERDELLNASPADIRELAKYIRAFMADECLCVVGSAEKIMDAKSLFLNVENLL